MERLLSIAAERRRFAHRPDLIADRVKLQINVTAGNKLLRQRKRFVPAEPGHLLRALDDLQTPPVIAEKGLQNQRVLPGGSATRQALRGPQQGDGGGHAGPVQSDGHLGLVVYGSDGRMAVDGWDRERFGPREQAEQPPAAATGHDQVKTRQPALITELVRGRPRVDQLHLMLARPQGGNHSAGLTLGEVPPLGDDSNLELPHCQNLLLDQVFSLYTEKQDQPLSVKAEPREC